MTRPAARDALRIIVDGDEIPGVIAYGVRPARRHPFPEFPRGVWIADPEVAPFTLHGENWEVLMWEIPVVIWPTASEMDASVRATLSSLIETGCRVAWIGAEGLPFCDPPQLFDTGCMSGSVLAWMTDAGTSNCWLDPEAPIAPATDDVLLSLRRHARGLADVH